MPPRSRAIAVVGLAVPIVLVAAVVAGLVLTAGSGGGGSLAAGALPSATATFPPLPPTASPAPSATPLAGETPLPSPSPTAGVDPLLGSDGRLTVLLLGTDYRPAHPGNRTDAIMVVSIDPTTGKSAAFSVPRDVVDFPMPKSGSYGAKVNGLYQHLESTTGDGGKGMKQAVSRAFGIEVDRYALIGFTGVTRAGRGRRRRRRHAGRAVLRPRVLGQQPPPGLGPASRQEPPQRGRRPHLRPKPQG